jgi:hypothetical protein
VSEPIDQVMTGCVVLVTADRRSGELGAALARRGAVIRYAPALLAGTRALIADPPDVVVVTTGIVPIVPDRGRLGSLVRTVVAHYGGLQTLQTVGGALQVHRGAAVLDGRVLPLSPSGLEVLRLLAAARGAVVPRSDVLAVLPGVSQDPHAAEVAIARLRETTGRDLIRTVVKRGYRLELMEAGTR